MSDLAARTGLPADAVQAIQQVLAACPAVEQALLYGSRAKGNYKRGSDIDLTLKGDALKQEADAMFEQLERELDLYIDSSSPPGIVIG